ncbi:hypothetical protein [Burkholderia cenocepacia]|uniref:hypothetical protein n=1 Tax=Burkholderia cenocepacia TaxID=95486 RepID=UPI002B24D47B|nr:hypothetical protein [Burkholderia cenocepacia]MEB2543768.1 hypothetical protein [Burkholderia cenocepacia]
MLDVVAADACKSRAPVTNDPEVGLYVLMQRGNVFGRRLQLAIAPRARSGGDTMKIFPVMVHFEHYTPRHASAEHEPPDERAAPSA